ncbi:hypothetical protein JCM9534A_17360 [Catenuloplanes indicus JCM 9534]
MGTYREGVDRSAWPPGSVMPGEMEYAQIAIYLKQCLEAQLTIIDQLRRVGLSAASAATLMAGWDQAHAAVQELAGYRGRASLRAVRRDC